MAKDWLRRLLTFEHPRSASLVEPGLHHIMQEAHGSFARFHLRVENDGSGMLIANAMAAARLTPSGVVIALGLLEGQAEDEIIQTLKKNFAGTHESMLHSDIQRVNELIERLKDPGDTYPVFNLEDAATSPDSAELIAPLQASLPLAAPDVIIPLLDRLWEVGIPHVTFLLPETFKADHAIRAVERAEDLGMIAGIRSRPSDIDDEDLLAGLRQAGVDHITFIYAAAHADIHNALCGAGDHAAAIRVIDWLQANQTSAIAEVPLVRATLDRISSTVDALLENQIHNLAFVAYVTTDEALAEREEIFTQKSMAQVATTVEETADMAQARFIWDPPIERDPKVTLSEQVRRGPRCTGDVAVRVEPSGEVIPPRGRYRSAGNLLRETWDDIWNDEVFRRFRELVESPTRCEVCPGLAICAADCPRDPQGWARGA